MALHPLRNKAFGFPSECFACDPDNPVGLRLSFFHDDEAVMVRSEFTLGPPYQGAPRFVHGGLLLAILDEAMAWAAIALAERFAISRTSRASFRRPVMIDVPHRVEAIVEDHDDTSVAALARIMNPEGKRCAEATARLVVLSEETARTAIGTDLGGSDRYLRSRK